MKNYKRYISIPIFVAVLTAASLRQADATAPTVTLQNATATYSQTTDGAGNPQPHPASAAIDGNSLPGPGNLNGWAIYEDTGVLGVDDQTHPQTAVFETASDVGFVGGSSISFRMVQNLYEHAVGRFRFSITTDDRSLFADGLQSGGDVTANWVVLNPNSLSSLNGATLTELGDFSILASGGLPLTDVYTITATTALTGITGIRLEVLEDPSLAFNGPGRNPANGNFTLTELNVEIVPEPSSALLVLFAAALCLLRRRSLPTHERNA